MFDILSREGMATKKMFGYALIGSVLAASALASPIEAFSSNPEVTIKNGTVRGFSIPDLGAEAFLGLRYARAPVSRGFFHYNFPDEQSAETA